MAIRAYYRTKLALDQLETALRLYAEGKEFASVITLAGAAEEIFGLAAKETKGVENAFDSLKRSTAEIFKAIYGEAPPPFAPATRGRGGEHAVFAGQRQQVRRIDRRRQHGHQRLAGSWWWQLERHGANHVLRHGAALVVLSFEHRHRASFQRRRVPFKRSDGGAYADHEGLSTAVGTGTRVPDIHG